MKKKCSKCQQIKPIEEFHKNRRRKDGHQDYCKSCFLKAKSDSQKIHYITNNGCQKNWRAKHPDRSWAIETLTSHRQRGFIVGLTLNQIIGLLHKNSKCQSCGKNLRLHRGKKGAVHDSPTLDRMNNENHMDLSNVLILCNQCNASKGKKTYQEFLETRRML